ncbi:thiamine pyrophosphate-binding protein [Gordonia sp. L191]|uniref:thiamine pyrophosphate-binding protein n=1 Tax=Gordonia sp. L191 TaxID=2982699 RepID=UPI0024C06B63|nr:thiamine pyrophosphate-binding protein [Gordonia sp. L191]WHU49537.1 thiamine pyrophosphate-binding protein [Gordonia sp. L191]
MTSRCRGRRVADHIVERMDAEGITSIFGVHGANIEELFDAAVRAGRTPPVIAKHEFAAAAMADGVARIFARPAAVFATSGGGALNVVAALAESYDSRVPVLAVIGAPATSTVGRGAFQDMLDPPDTIDLRATLSGVAGSVGVVVRATEIDAVLDEATQTLRRSLPAVIVVPKDVAAEHHPDGGPPPRRPVETPAVPDLTATIDRLVADRGRVCIWVGDEASRAGLSAPVHTLADLLGASVVVAPGGRDIARPGCAGVTGVMGHPSALRAIADARTCLVLGCRLTLTDRAGLDELLATRTVVHLGAHAPRLPGTEHIPCGRLAEGVSDLVEQLRRRIGTRHGPADTRFDRRAVEFLPALDPGSELPRMSAVVDAVGRHLPDDAVVFADAGNIGAAAVHHLPFGRGRFAIALGMGGMGHAIAAGVGVAIAGADDVGSAPRTVVITGDGSFLMHGMEIHTAIEHRAPVTLIVANNNAHGMCVTRERIFFPDTPGLNTFGPTDIAAGLAAMFPDLPVRRVTDPRDLDATTRDVLTRPGPACLVVDTDPDEIPPFHPLRRGFR